MLTELSKNDAKEMLRDVGLRATAPRVAVLRLLAQAKRPLSHSEVVSEMGPSDWDQATLYRNLVCLVDYDLATVASNIGGIARYELRSDDKTLHLHPHFSCRTCGSVECLPTAKLEGPVSAEWGMSLASAELQLIGVCPRCT